MKFAPIPKPPPDAAVMYRYDDGFHYNMDVSTKPILLKLYVTKNTPKGFWVTDEFCLLHKWTPNYGKKRYAYPTILEAAESYHHRKRKQLEIFTNRIHSIKACLVGAMEMLKTIKDTGTDPQATPPESSDEIPF